jgi:CheY-like chemotaxis protein
MPCGRRRHCAKTAHEVCESGASGARDHQEGGQPRHQNRGYSEGGPGPPRGQQGTPHILFADADPDACATLSNILTDLGFRVDGAYDGPATLVLIEQNGYGLALLDYRMAGMGGLELYRRIRQVRSSLVGAFVTAFTASGIGEAAMEAVVRRTLSKPMDLDELLPPSEEIVGKPD